jgi:hypothetical protein
MALAMVFNATFNNNLASAQSEQFENPIEKSQKEYKSTPLAHKYTVDHFLGLLQAFQ